VNNSKYQLVVSITLALGLSGCASLVAEYIQGAASFGYEHVVSDADITSLGFERGRFCPPGGEFCVGYLAGKAIGGERLRYETELGSGASSTSVVLDLSRESVPVGLHGTVVLLHGYRASKEFMLNTALYFRFLGFEVLVPDLLGHGESGGEKGYGVRDRYVIDEFISAIHASGEPLLLLGNSMGALTAVYVSEMRPDVSGVILQAPMLTFDEAVLRYTKANHPYLATLLGDRAIVSGALRALQEAKLEVGDTDINGPISRAQVPVLLFASPQDPIAPYEKFTHLKSSGVVVKALTDRNHPSMVVVGNESGASIIEWLGDLERESGS
jgi:pimeloyl-ACP methyl ester carboxylesterase